MYKIIDKFHLLVSCLVYANELTTFLIKQTAAIYKIMKFLNLFPILIAGLAIQTIHTRYFLVQLNQKLHQKLVVEGMIFSNDIQTI